MWRIEPVRVDEGTVRWSCLTGTDRALAFEQVAHAWSGDGAFRRFWIESLRQVPFDAYCWECPPVHEPNRTRPFECVFVSSLSLSRMPVAKIKRSSRCVGRGGLRELDNHPAICG